MAYSLAEKFAGLDEDAQVKILFQIIERNHLIRCFDLRDEPVARSWKQHRQQIIRLVEEHPNQGVIAALQRSPKGYWLSEWTAMGYQVPADAERRRAAVGKDLVTLGENFLKELSYHQSHYFKPEEGLRGWYKRL